VSACELITTYGKVTVKLAGRRAVSETVTTLEGAEALAFTYRKALARNCDYGLVTVSEVVRHSVGVCPACGEVTR
jgi:hypothetical protein